MKREEGKVRGEMYEMRGGGGGEMKEWDMKEGEEVEKERRVGKVEGERKRKIK